MSDAAVRETDVVVIGAGPGGYAAAFAIADRGFKVAVVDADPEPGGVCLNRGCIPSKSLLHVARLIGEVREAKEWGLSFGEPRIDVARLRSWKNEVIGKLNGGIRQMAKLRQVDLVRAWARFEDSQTLLLSTERGAAPDRGRLKFKRAVVAAGSRPAVIPAFDIGSPRIWNSTSALELSAVPQTLLIVGGGYIGLEMGTVYAALGSEVTVVEMTEGLLPGADRDLVRVLELRLRKAFKSVYLNTKVSKVTEAGSGVAVTFEAVGGAKAGPKAPPATAEFERVLVSVGRTPNSDGLGLENTKAKVTGRGFVEVDPQLRTDDAHIWAIGDIAGEPMLAHKAAYEAKVVAEVFAGHKAAVDAKAIPAVVFTDPEIAWAGLTENQAKAAGTEVKIAKFPWGASGRATANGRNDGVTKVIASPASKQVLGVGIVGSGAGELISEAVVAIEMGATAEDLALCIHPHPTLSETVMEAAEAVFGSSTHQAPPRR
ncbi:MAG: dihydrolipoyl dehydrogenase [Phycisphaerae bacterium]|nr:dihydrolipoyl dehydrogenase [Phycisphaerae bacterium]